MSVNDETLPDDGDEVNLVSSETDYVTEDGDLVTDELTEVVDADGERVGCR